MSFKSGRYAKVTLGAATVVGMGTWEMPGISVDLLESTAFGDTAKQYLTGLLDYGDVTFSGLYDPGDTTGQQVLVSANINNSAQNNVRLYVDNTSYWTPNKTVASGGLTASSMYVTSIAIGMDKSGLGTIKFTGKATGPWCLTSGT